MHSYTYNLTQTFNIIYDYIFHKKINYKYFLQIYSDKCSNHGFKTYTVLNSCYQASIQDTRVKPHFFS